MKGNFCLNVENFLVALESNEINHYIATITDNLELLNIKPFPINSFNHVNSFFAGIGSTLAQDTLDGNPATINGHKEDQCDPVVSSFALLYAEEERSSGILSGADILANT